jgi:hypothetical protein
MFLKRIISKMQSEMKLWPVTTVTEKATRFGLRNAALTRKCLNPKGILNLG